MWISNALQYGELKNYALPPLQTKQDTNENGISLQ